MLPKRLKELRKEHNITQGELAAQLGITQQAVGRWEGGLSSPDSDTLGRLADLFGTTVDDLLGRSVRALGVTPYIAITESLVPVVGTVRAGYGALAFEEDYGCEPATVKDPGNYFYLVVKGNSMEPRIRDGDLALVRKQPMLDDGDLGVVIFGEGEGTLKKFARRGSAVLLQPFNPEYDTLVITGQDLESLHVAGKVVETKAKW